MKKILNFLEGEKERILEQHRKANEKKLFLEQNTNLQDKTISGTGSDKYDYKREKGRYFTKLKTASKWIDITNTRFEAPVRKNIFKDYDVTDKKVDQTIPKVQTNVEKQVSGKGSNFCQTVTKDSSKIKDIKMTILLLGGEQVVNDLMNSFALKFNEAGIPKEISCQIALNRLRPTYKDKNTIIVDSYNKLIYVFDKNNKFIAKDVIISGYNKQSQDAKKIAHALLSWEEACKEEGFAWKDGVGYVDVTGKGRKYNPDIIYNAAEKMGSRFLPADIYKSAGKTKDNPHYAGGEKNVLNLFQLSDNNKAKEISIAIHGYYLEQPRKLALDKARKLLGNPSNPSVSEEFLDAVGAGKINLSQSYGCINLSEDFVPILNKYITDSYIFNISEDRNNYLVDNSYEFLKKNQETPNCLSPDSFNAENMGNWA